MTGWSRDLWRSGGALAAMALLLLAGCARPRLPITTAPAAAATPAKKTTKPARHETPGDASAAVPLATAAILGSSMEADVEYLHSRALVLPVAGIRPDQLSDSFDEPRDGSPPARPTDLPPPPGPPPPA